DTRQSLDFRASLFAVYDKDSEPNLASDGTQDGRLTQTGGAGGLNAGLAYNYQADKTQFFVNGTGTLQDYVQSHSLTAATYGTNAGVMTTIRPKIKLVARSSASYSPFYFVLPFTGTSTISLGAAPSLASSFTPGFAFASTSERNVFLDDYVGVTDNLTKSS